MNINSPLLTLVARNMSSCNFVCVSLSEGVLRNESGNILAGLTDITNQVPDAVILDLGQPDQASWNYAQELRQMIPGPLIIVTAPPSSTMVAATQAHKLPLERSIKAAEHQVRVHVAKRHLESPEPEPAIFQLDELRVDLARRLVTLRGKEVLLTPNEFRLLSLMIQFAGRVLTHQFLLETVWGVERVKDLQSLRVYMSSLRHKIEVQPAKPQHLLTIQGIGYRLKAP